MKTPDELLTELEASNKTFNADVFTDCVDRAMLLVQHNKALMLEDGLKWPFSSDNVLRAACERKIEDRPHGDCLWVAAIKFVTEIQERAEVYNGIYCKEEDAFAQEVHE